MAWTALRLRRECGGVAGFGLWVWNSPPGPRKGGRVRSGRWLSATLWVFVSLAAASTAVAQNPFVGTWKLNQEKSQMAGDIMKFRPAAGDAIELSGGGATYSFRAGGKPVRLPTGPGAPR